MTYLWPLNIHLFLDCMTFWIKFTISSKSFKTLELSSYILVKSETYMCVGHLQCDSNFPAFASKSNDFFPLPNCLQMVSISRLHLAFPQFLQFTPSFYVDLFGLFLSEYTISKCEILWLSSLWEIHVLFRKKIYLFVLKFASFLPFPYYCLFLSWQFSDFSHPLSFHTNLSLSTPSAVLCNFSMHSIFFSEIHSTYFHFTWENLFSLPIFFLPYYFHFFWLTLTLTNVSICLCGSCQSLDDFHVLWRFFFFDLSFLRTTSFSWTYRTHWIIFIFSHQFCQFSTPKILSSSLPIM